MAEADPSGITRKYIYGKGLIALATASARYCYHFNGIGSATALTDMSKNVVNAYAYDPFGRILLEQEAIQQPFKYVGQYRVMAKPGGLYYMRARYYDPNVWRFITEDPLGFAGGDVNLYAYGGNDPVNWVDPFGLAKIKIRPPYGITKPEPNFPGAGSDQRHVHWGTKKDPRCGGSIGKDGIPREKSDMPPREILDMIRRMYGWFENPDAVVPLFMFDRQIKYPDNPGFNPYLPIDPITDKPMS